MVDDAEAEARRIAEAAMQGWKALSQSGEDATASPGFKADGQGTDIPALQQKYAADAFPPVAPTPLQRTFIVPMQASTEDAPGPTRRNVVVSGGRVIAMEG